MNLLLDTQAFLWFENGDDHLPSFARQSILNSSNVKYISIASFWEITIKNSLGKLQLHLSVDELLLLKGYIHIGISGRHLMVLHQLPYHHRDPFDRMLAAQAISENLHIISSDKQFDVYGVKRIWSSATS